MERVLEYGFKRKNEEKPCFGSDLGKGKRLPIPNIPGDEWENQSTRGKTPLVRCSANPDINPDEGFTSIKAQENNNNKRERERQRDAHIHSHTTVQAYMT